MDSEEQAISRAATIQMRAAADLTVRSPREYCLCLPRAGITPGFRANGGNCLTSRLDWQRRQVVESEVAGSSAFGLGAFVHTLRAVCGTDVAEPAFLCARHPCYPCFGGHLGASTVGLRDCFQHREDVLNGEPANSLVWLAIVPSRSCWSSLSFRLMFSQRCCCVVGRTHAS